MDVEIALKTMSTKSFFIVLMGEFKQTTELFHRILCKTTDSAASNSFLISQKTQVFYA